VKCRCAESLGVLSIAAGEDGANALVEALASDSDVGVRWRCAMSLGKLGYAAMENGACALLKALTEDKSLAVKDHAGDAITDLRDSCVKMLEGLEGHLFYRGQAAWVLGRLGASAGKPGIDLLVATLLRPSEDVYLRRRAAEALGKVGKAGGGLCALALKRAGRDDEDVYVQWQSGEFYAGLAPEVQEEADQHEEALIEVMKEDFRRMSIAKEARGESVDPLQRWDRWLHVKTLPNEAARKESPQVLKEVPAKVEAALEAPPAEAGLEPPPPPPPEDVPQDVQVPVEEERKNLIEEIPDEETEEPQSFELDLARINDLFKTLSVDGEVSRQNLAEALKMLGHEHVNQEWVDAIVAGALNNREFLDNYDFTKFLEQYEAMHWNYVRQKFTEADVDGSGKVDAEELSTLFRKSGYTPVRGVVPKLIAEICGARAHDVSFNRFARILNVLRHRYGFTADEYAEIVASFRRHDRDRDGFLAALDLRSCLSWLGFDISLEETSELISAVSPKQGEQTEPMVHDFEVVRIVRMVREAEARKVLDAMRELNGNDEDTAPDMPDRVTIINQEDLPAVLTDLQVQMASPLVVHEIIEDLGLLHHSVLTVEDIMPLLWSIRKCQGFSREEFAEAKALFEKNDIDGSHGMAGAELEAAVRSLGYPVVFEDVQDQLDAWDIDDTGELDFIEFLKVLSHYRKQELKSILKSMMHGQDRLGRRVSMSTKTLPELPSILLGAGYAPLREQSTTLSRATKDSSSESIGIWKFSDLISEYRKEINMEIRRNQGYTAQQVEELREAFRQFDTNQNGTIERKELRLLILRVEPRAEHSTEGHAQMAAIVKESDANESASIDFQEFLTFMRLVTERCSREKLAKEQKAAKETNFSVRELKQFRKVYKGFDTDTSGDMNFKELQHMIATIVASADGSKAERSLHEIFEMFDGNKDQKLDFPEFLHVMRHILDTNWNGINDQTKV